jgi:hypothetical protein
MSMNRVQVFQADTASRNPCIVMHLSKPKTRNEEWRQARTLDIEVVKVVDVHLLRAKL